jgi:hexosaminidase
MKKLFIVPFIFVIFTTSGQSGEVSIIPQPAQIQQGKGSFKLKAGTTISYDNSSVKEIAEMLAMKLNQATGLRVITAEGRKGKIQFNINAGENNLLGKEGYSLSVTSKNIIITANQPAGLFYGLQSLFQLMLPDYRSVPAVNITDYPRFAWRGIMLDVSRNFFTKEEVKKYIDEISKFKFNVFHWHLTDDNGWRIEIKSLPKLTEVGAWRVARTGHFGDRDNPKPGEAATVGGFYTKEDIREIVKYAQERYITIVPEVDIPGHSMAAIASYPELCCTKNPDIKVNPGTEFSEWYADGTFKMLVDNTLNPSDEKVYEFLDKVFTEVAQLFPGQYIHAGGDECYKGYWEADTNCQALMKKLGITKVEQLQGYFVNRVEKILQSKGKKLIGWDEILEGGISPDATVMSWRGMQGGIDAAKLGHDVVMTPTSFVYLDYQQGEKTIEPPLYADLRLRKCYSFNPVPEGVDPKYILGGQGNLWTEQIPEFRHAEYMTWPRGWALAEDFWTPVEKKSWPDFISRVEKQFFRSDVEGINYSKAVYDPVISIKKADGKTFVEMDTEAPRLKIYYTLDDQMPDSFSPEYIKPFEIPTGGPVTLRVISYRDGKPIGHLITLRPEDLKKR